MEASLPAKPIAPAPVRHPVVEADLRAIQDVEVDWNELRGSTVLVTGASGVVAAYLVEALLYRNEIDPQFGCRVLALSRSRAALERRFAAYRNRPDLEMLAHDVAEPLDIASQVHFIVHAASKASATHIQTDPTGVLRANVGGTLNLLEFARRKRCRGFLFVSSGEVYGRREPSPGDPPTELQFGSLDPLDPRACYAEGKRAAEAMCLAWARQHGVPTRIVRLGHTYGPGIDLADERVFASFVRCVLEHRDIVLATDGRAARPFCYLTDATAGMLTVLLKGEPGTAYNLMNDEALVQMRDLAEMLVRIFPERKLRVVYPPASDRAASLHWNPGTQAPSTARIRRLGWRPRISVAEGFRRTLASFAPADVARVSPAAPHGPDGAAPSDQTHPNLARFS